MNEQLSWCIYLIICGLIELKWYTAQVFISLCPCNLYIHAVLSVWLRATHALCVCVCVSVRTHLCVSPWLLCECGLLAEDTGTHGPAGEGDEAQLGIIKPSTVSMKGPGSQAGLVSPRQSSLDGDWLHHSLHCVPRSEEEAQIWQRLSIANASG